MWEGLKILNLNYKIKIVTHNDPAHPNKEDVILFIPNIRCLKNILWGGYRFFEFTSSNDIDQFKNHYKNLENFNNLNWDVQLFESLLKISGVESVSLIGESTVCIKKRTSSDWEEINREVQKSFYKFLDIPSEDRK